MKRHRISKRKSKKDFRRNVKTSYKPVPMRGGFRI
jgi:hypothetical protein